MIQINKYALMEELTHDLSFNMSFMTLLAGFLDDSLGEIQRYTLGFQLKRLLEKHSLITYLNEEDTEQLSKKDSIDLQVEAILHHNFKDNQINDSLFKNIEIINIDEQLKNKKINNTDTMYAVEQFYKNHALASQQQLQHRMPQDLQTTINQLIEQFSKTGINKAYNFSTPMELEHLDLNVEDTIDNIENKICWIENDAISQLHEEMNKVTPEKANKIKSYLEKIVSYKDIVTVSDYQIFNQVEDQLPNFSEVIKFFKGNFVLNAARRKKENNYLTPTPILLLGDPGIGKTHFAQILAKQLGTHFHFFDSNSITASWVLTGSSGQWQNADCGAIFKIMLASNTVSPVVIFDEIDKLSSGKNYDPYSTFHQLLEPANSKIFKDEFLNIQFDASHLIYILTANDISNIPKSLLSRMKVFHISQASALETRKIAQTMYKDIIGQSDLFTPTLNESNLQLLEHLVPRDIKKILKEAVFNQAADIMELTDQNLIINKQIINQQKWGF